MFTYTLGYNRAIGSAYKGSTQQYFQGSSLNRKPVVKKEQNQVLQTAKEIFFKAVDERNPQPEANVLSRIKAPHSNSFRDGRTISRRSKQKIKDKIFALYRSSGNSNFTFLTLTLIGSSTDRAGVTVLNKFLTVLRTKYGKFVYIWIAERQENGNIHFHVILSRHFPIQYINSLWVIQQFNAGIVNTQAAGRVLAVHNTTFQDLHKQGRYSDVQKFLNPVDIKKITSIDGLSCYLTEYITKNQDTFRCLPWHCNREVSKLFTKQLISKRTFAKTSCKAKNRITSRKGKTYINQTYVGQHCIINTIYNKQHFQKYLHELEQVNKWILENHEKVDQTIVFDEMQFRNLVYDGITSINQN
jgi:hypothetical protein